VNQGKPASLAPSSCACTAHLSSEPARPCYLCSAPGLACVALQPSPALARCVPLARTRRALAPRRLRAQPLPPHQPSRPCAPSNCRPLPLLCAARLRALALAQPLRPPATRARAEPPPLAWSRLLPRAPHLRAREPAPPSSCRRLGSGCPAPAPAATRAPEPERPHACSSAPTPPCLLWSGGEREGGNKDALGCCCRR
jgi:hypothetical protein